MFWLVEFWKKLQVQMIESRVEREWLEAALKLPTLISLERRGVESWFYVRNKAQCMKNINLHCLQVRVARMGRRILYFYSLMKETSLTFSLAITVSESTQKGLHGDFIVVVVTWFAQSSSWTQSYFLQWSSSLLYPPSRFIFLVVFSSQYPPSRFIFFSCVQL